MPRITEGKTNMEFSQELLNKHSPTESIFFLLGCLDVLEKEIDESRKTIMRLSDELVDLKYSRKVACARGGMSTSEAKIAASRANGLKGGRPKRVAG